MNVETMICLMIPFMSRIHLRVGAWVGLVKSDIASSYVKCTLEFLINVPVRLLISDQFSHQYVLIRTSMFILHEQLMIL